MGVSESLSSKIKSFFCHICRSKKPSLSIKYKSKYREIARNVEKNSKFDESSHDSSSVKFYRESKARLKKEAELLKSMANTESKHGNISKSDASFKRVRDEASTSIQARTDTDTNSLDVPSTKYYGKTNIPSEDIANFFSAITIMNQNVPPQQSKNQTNVNQMDHDYLGRYLFFIFLIRL